MTIRKWNRKYCSYYYHHHHHHQHNKVVLIAQNSLTLTLTIYPYNPLFWAGLLNSAVVYNSLLVHSWVGDHKRMLLMSLFLFLQLCPACFVHLTWMVCEMGSRWLYKCCFVGCCFQFVRVNVVIQCSSTDTSTTLKKSHFILSER